MRDIIDRMADNEADVSDVIGGTRSPWVMKALGEIGEKEWDNAWNPSIKEYQNTTVPSHFDDDGGGRNAWCAAFVNWSMQETETPGMTGYDSMRARAWSKWGQKHDGPGFGVIGVKKSGSQHHVGFIIGTTSNGGVVMLGGNQSNSVNIAVYPRSEFNHPSAGFRVPSGSGIYPNIRINNTNGFSEKRGTR